jgi:hypothetical protein
MRWPDWWLAAAALLVLLVAMAGAVHAFVTQ